MLAIAYREFIQLFKSFKSIAVIVLFCGISYWISSLLNKYPILMNESQLSAGYVSGITVLLYLFGFLFVMTLSHDILNKEMETQTIRLIVTKVSRSAVLLGKLVGIALFWLVCLLLSFLIISLFSGQFYLLKLLQLFSFLTYPIGLVLIVSLLVRRTGHSILFSLLGGILFPWIGLWSYYGEPASWKLIKYAMPYYYLLQEQSAWLSLVPFAMACLMVIAAVTAFNRRDI
ncbi:ABC transporter permease [Paenibacillus sp. y28]|uniref:ABC transporter permease n=1 Tax=Paenibacillus sp. y28 TaxID=3129110 RepID=UPI00301AF83F